MKIQRIKGKNTDWILKQLWGKNRTEKNRDTFSKSFWKIAGLEITFIDVEFHEAEFPFCNHNFVKVKHEKQNIYTTLTLHKYRNNNYCTQYQQTLT